MELKVPRRTEPGWKIILAAPDERMEAIFAALNDAAPALRVRDLADQVASRAGISQSDALAVVEAVAGLYLLMEQGGTDEQSVAESVMDALKRADNPDIRVTEGGEVQVKSRVARLLSFGTVLGTTAKALDVILEHERAFCKARVLTDLRPIFPFRSEGMPVGFAITHDLRIRYHQGGSGDRSEFHVCLDRDAVDELIQVLERAKRKDNALKALLAGSNLKVMGGREIHD